MVVVPVVAVLSDPSILGELKAHEGEVAQIFTHPLMAILDPNLAQSEPLVEGGSADWPYETDLYVRLRVFVLILDRLWVYLESCCQHTSDSSVPTLGDTIYRMHRFRSSASPIKGLTADILVRTGFLLLFLFFGIDRYDGLPRSRLLRLLLRGPRFMRDMRLDRCRLFRR